jgi:hypothetical protein
MKGHQSSRFSYLLSVLTDVIKILTYSFQAKKRQRMPRFLDRHATVPMPSEAVKAVVEKMKSGEVDEFGVRGLNAFVGEKDTWCYTEAPNAEAVHKEHEAMGLNLRPGDVTQKQSLV